LPTRWQPFARNFTIILHSLTGRKAFRKFGIKGNDYGTLYVKSHVLDFQIQKAKMLDLEFLSRAMEVSDNCPLKETQDLFKRFKEMQ
jgi:hypothetical protein